MPLVLRNVKGSQLTFNEMDGNFTYLEGLSQTGSFTGSFIGDGSGLTNIPGVTPIATGSFATTGSNQFNGGQSISGSVTISGSLLQGAQSIASGIFSHAEGYKTTASAAYSHAEGGLGIISGTDWVGGKAIGTGSHAEGVYTLASGLGSHAEGIFTTASNESAHSEGESTLASGPSSHSEGQYTTASAAYSHAEGVGTITNEIWQHAQGMWNITSSAQGAFILGNGVDHNNRSNLIFAAGNSVQITGSLLVTGSANIRGNQTLTSGSLIVTGSSLFISPSYGNGIGANNSGSKFTQNTTTVSMVIKPSGSFNYGNISVSDNNDSNSTVNLYGSTLLIGSTSANSILFGNASTNSNFFGTYNFRTGINVTGSLLVTGSANINGFMTYPQVSASLNFADDTAAQAGGVPLGGLYRNGNAIQIRLV